LLLLLLLLEVIFEVIGWFGIVVAVLGFMAVVADGVIVVVSV
jgi:hypothetical protein